MMKIFILSQLLLFFVLATIALKIRIEMYYEKAVIQVDMLIDKYHYMAKTTPPIAFAHQYQQELISIIKHKFFIRFLPIRLQEGIESIETLIKIKTTP